MPLAAPAGQPLEVVKPVEPAYGAGPGQVQITGDDDIGLGHDIVWIIAVALLTKLADRIANTRHLVSILVQRRHDK